MNGLLRSLHVLSVALWFGAVAFFSLMGLLLFGAFADASRLPAGERPVWLPVPPAYDRPSPGPGFHDPLRLEQGSRAAGVAVGRILPAYYALQAGCGMVALLTAWLLARRAAGERGWRTGLAAVALLTALAGWWLEGEVSRLRGPRNRLTDEVLAVAEPPAGQVEEARLARATFATWHGYSLAQNFATLLLVGWLTVLVPSASRGTPPG
jgi:hypothetical protein